LEIARHRLNLLVLRLEGFRLQGFRSKGVEVGQLRFGRGVRPLRLRLGRRIRFTGYWDWLHVSLSFW
jgi:hypothetical protein